VTCDVSFVLSTLFAASKAVSCRALKSWGSKKLQVTERSPFSFRFQILPERSKLRILKNIF